MEITLKYRTSQPRANAHFHGWQRRVSYWQRANLINFLSSKPMFPSLHLDHNTPMTCAGVFHLLSAHLFTRLAAQFKRNKQSRSCQTRMAILSTQIDQYPPLMVHCKPHCWYLCRSRSIWYQTMHLLKKRGRYKESRHRCIALSRLWRWCTPGRESCSRFGRLRRKLIRGGWRRRWG